MKRLHTTDPRGEAGYAMAVTLLVLFLLSLALSLVGLSLSIRLRMVKGETEAVMRGALADAALDEALANLALDEGYEGDALHDLGEGKIESRVEEMGEGSNRYLVIATGRYGTKARTIQATVYRSGGGVLVESWRLTSTGEEDPSGEATPP